MDHDDVGRYWDANADAWTTLARAGFDEYRDHLNTPAFLASLPAVAGRRGLDVGCGEGHNTRQVARLGADMVAVDVSERFIGHARQAEEAEPLGIAYRVASAQELPFEAESFDFVTSFMCLMDVPDAAAALGEVVRVLRPGGFLQFSITHPCSDTPHRRNLRGPGGRTYAIEVGGYFDGQPGAIEEWIFSSAPPSARAGMPKFRVPRFHRPLSEWLNLVIRSGLIIEHAGEPCPSDEAVEACPRIQDARVVPYFFHLRARKPGGARGFDGSR